MTVTVQSTYSRTLVAGTAGQPATMSGWDADTKICETVAGIGFGLAVSQGSAANGVTLGGAAFVGVSLRDVTLPPSQTDKYIQTQNMSVFVRGDIWVNVEDDVAIGHEVKYDATTGQMGHTGGTAVPNARWMTAASAGGLAILRLDAAAGPGA